MLALVLVVLWYYSSTSGGGVAEISMPGKISVKTVPPRRPLAACTKRKDWPVGAKRDSKPGIIVIVVIISIIIVIIIVIINVIIIVISSSITITVLHLPVVSATVENILIVLSPCGKNEIVVTIEYRAWRYAPTHTPLPRIASPPGSTHLPGILFFCPATRSPPPSPSYRLLSSCHGKGGTLGRSILCNNRVLLTCR